MARRRQAVTVEPLGIVELGEVCARMRARSLDAFERCGRWVTSTPPGELQRLLAEACHRHAWHAELWAARAPAIPSIDLEALTAAARGVRDLPGVEVYRELLDELTSELDALTARVDPVLDPSTIRTIALVRTDLTALRDRLP